MRVIIENTSLYILRFDTDEEVLTALATFCTKEYIQAAYFTAIGTVKEVTLSYYHLESQAYQDKTLNEELEITGVTGNVGVKDGGVLIHAHGTFGKDTYGIIGGHVKKLVVSATCEVALQKLEGIIERSHDRTTGLNLMK